MIGGAPTFSWRQAMPKPKDKYEDYDAIKPYSDLVIKGLSGLVDGDHFLGLRAIEWVI
jgi:hypothetical protein